ncbi:GNAT family N-acetyltransferase [Brevibacillus sp. 179-C 1.1 NHS]|uniref:GNAT family N-acetyltransferase n=1 Tax=Brevibacillus sp. 179-C 1.1 NHS TaxID=3235177 RepID=UPI0039A1396B
MRNDYQQIRYVVDDHELQASHFLDLVQNVWPGRYDIESVKQALDRTINITAWDQEKLIGCIRILTDGYLFGTIPEILVRPHYQSKGIGRHLMELAWEHSPTSLFFGAQSGNELFFEKLGYTKSMQSYHKRKPRKGARQ